MTTRILPVEEWPRLAGTTTEAATALDPKVCRIIVIENGAGEIVGSWALFCQWHAEAMWIAPGHRGRGVVFRKLAGAMRQLAQAFGARAVWACTDEPDVMEMARKSGAVVMPGQHFMVPLGTAQE